MQDGVEFTDFVRESNLGKQRFDVSGRSWPDEVVLADAELSEGRGEQDVDGLGLVTVVLMVCH